MSLDEALIIIKQIATQLPIAKWEEREIVRTAVVTTENAFRTLAELQSAKTDKPIVVK